MRLSKRAGNIVTLEDLVEEIGVDAARLAVSSGQRVRVRSRVGRIEL